MRVVALVVLSTLLGLSRPGLGQTVGTRSPAVVVVELFTSQGCSSCPPADVVLETLERNQPVAGAVVVALSEHVDYWNRLGWRDPFSSPRFSRRQEAYAAALGLPSLYTPMMVVDGEVALVGSQLAEARRAVTRAAAGPTIPVAVTAHGSPASQVVEVTATLGAWPAAAAGATVDVWLAITEGGISTEVTAGENAFRTLRHTGVVRHLERLAGGVDRARAQGGRTARLRLDPGWRRDRLRAVVFLQRPDAGAIVGAASAPIS